jgi:hypothetical protein
MKKSAIIAVACLTVTNGLKADTKTETLSLTGGLPVRFLWLQNDAGEPYGIEPCRLMAWDTDSGTERRLVDDLIITRQMWSEAIALSQDGAVAFFAGMDGHTYRVDWSGKNRSKLLDNALPLCCIFTGGKHWLYYCVDRVNVHRLNIYDPGERQHVWTLTQNYGEIDTLEVEWFQVSPDGMQATGAFTWNVCGMVDIGATGTFRELYRGCWPSISPDSTYRMGCMNWAHTGIYLYDKDGARLAEIGTAVHTGGNVAYHPRWSTHLRFYTFTGPYNDLIPEGNQSEIYLARFDQGYTAFEGTVKITANSGIDINPIVWVRPPDLPVPSLTVDTLWFECAGAGGGPAAQTIGVSAPFGMASDTAAVTVEEDAEWLAVERVMEGGPVGLVNTVTCPAAAGDRSVRVRVNVCGADRTWYTVNLGVNVEAGAPGRSSAERAWAPVRPEERVAFLPGRGPVAPQGGRVYGLDGRSAGSGSPFFRKNTGAPALYIFLPCQADSHPNR